MTHGLQLPESPRWLPWSESKLCLRIKRFWNSEARTSRIHLSRMLLVSIDELIKHLRLSPDERLYKLFVAPNGFAMVAKAMPQGWIAYRMGTFQFFGANKEVMHYREFAGIRRSADLFEAFVDRYRKLAEDNDLDWIVEDLQGLPTREAQLAHLAAQGYFDV
jgi:hypothetical protein